MDALSFDALFVWLDWLVRLIEGFRWFECSSQHQSSFGFAIDWSLVRPTRPGVVSGSSSALIWLVCEAAAGYQEYF